MSIRVPQQWTENRPAVGADAAHRREKRRIGRAWMMHPVLLRKRYDVVVAVHRRGGAGKERPDVHLPGKLHHRLRARDVEVRAADGVADRGPHPGLHRQVDDSIEGLPLEDVHQEAGVVDVLRQEPKARVNSFLRRDRNASPQDIVHTLVWFTRQFRCR